MTRFEKKANRDKRLREVQASSFDPISQRKADEIRAAQDWAMKNQARTGINANEFLSRRFTMGGKTR